MFNLLAIIFSSFLAFLVFEKERKEFLLELIFTIFFVWVINLFAGFLIINGFKKIKSERGTGIFFLSVGLFIFLLTIYYLTSF